MARVFVVRTVDQALDVLRTLAHDGDTIRLVAYAAGMYSKLAVESTAVALGLDVVVEVGSALTAFGGTEQGIVGRQMAAGEGMDHG